VNISLLTVKVTPETPAEEIISVKIIEKIFKYPLAFFQGNMENRDISGLVFVALMFIGAA